MIVITGASGFIGSVVLGYFNQKGRMDILAVDEFDNSLKWKNLSAKKFVDFIDKDEFLTKLNDYKDITSIIHLGANTDTTVSDLKTLMTSNFEYSKKLFSFAADKNIPFIYASSAATYGDGSNGYIDDENDLFNLRPLNAYGFSKQLFDQWVLSSGKRPCFWAGLKFFNVYGPNEYHKGKMASMVYQTYCQLVNNKKIKLFKSYDNKYAHGEQKRDFISVFDVAKIIYYFYSRSGISGIYNVGTGNAKSFNTLAQLLIKYSKIKGEIEYIDMPLNIRDKYQYYTEASVKKIIKTGIDTSLHSVEDGIKEYVEQYLKMEVQYF